MLAAVTAFAIALHRFSPSLWPPLAVDILHSLHGSGFAVLALLIYCYLQRRFPARVNYLLAAIITMSIGLISELAQIPGPREAQLSDLLVDGLGIFGALGVLAAFDKDVRKYLRRPVRMLLPVTAGTALAIACVPSVWLTYAMVQQYRSFPQLLTFEHAWERPIFGQTAFDRPSIISPPTPWPTPGKNVAHAVESGRWGIFISVHPKPDWRGFSKLSFIAASVDGNFGLGISVKDMPKAGETQGARYYKVVSVDSDPKRYTVTFDEILRNSSGREFDFSFVEAVVLSTDKAGSGREIIIDDFRLEP